MLNVDIRAQKVYEHYIFIENPNSTIHWEFSTKKHGIRFGLFFKPGTYTNIQTESSGERAYANTALEKLRPIEHFQCAKKTVRDSFTVQYPGYYVLLFDNTHSIFTKRSLQLTVTSDDPSLKNTENIPVFSGWLQTKSHWFKSWKKQWFEYFPSGNLRIYPKPDSPMTSAVQIRLCSLSTSSSKKIIKVNSGKTKLSLKAQSKDDFIKWVSYFDNDGAFNMDGTRSAKIVPGKATTTRPIHILTSLDDLNTEVGTLRGLIHQSMTKEAKFGNQSQESAYPMSTSIKRSLGFRKSSKKVADVPSSDLKQDFEGMLSSVNRIDKCKTDIYSGYIAQMNGTDSLSRNERPRPHSLTEEFSDPNRFGSAEFDDDAEEFYSAVDDTSNRNIASLEHSNNENNSKTKENTALITSGTSQSLPPAPRNRKTITRRDRLPKPASEITISLSSLFTNLIGHNMAPVSLPICISEPLNTMQRQCEELEYSYLLDKASEQKTSMERLLYVVLFAISGYASSQYRTCRKPFNPMLAETFECIRPDRGFRFIAEKVSHNPDIMACFAESKNFEFRQIAERNFQLWANSLECQPRGSNHITLVKHREHFTYTKPTSWLCSLLYSTRHMAHGGNMTVTNHATGEHAIVSFKTPTCLNPFRRPKDKNNVIAQFFNRAKKPMFEVTGTWSDELHPSDNTTKSLWKVNPPALPNYKDYFGFTQYCMELNEITAIEKGKLPKTDTRLRPDQRLLENGHVKEADAEKKRIEKVQRVNRAKYDTDTNPWSPVWFEKRRDDSDPEGESWFYKGGYWEAREKGEWPSLSFNLW